MARLPILQSSLDRTSRRSRCRGRAVAMALALPIAAWASPAHAQVQQPRYQPGWPCNGTVDPAYISTAEATGGTVLLFAPSEITGLALTHTASERHSEVVLRAGARVDDGLHEFDIPVDSSIESAYFFVSLQCLQGISIVGPSGEEVRSDAPGVEFHAFEAIRLLTVQAPTRGMWKIRVAGRGFLSVIVRARTDVRLANVAFSGTRPTVKRAPQRLEVSVEGAVSQVAFHAMSAGANVLKLLNLELEKQEDTSRTYGGMVIAPAVDFRIAVTGTDANGFRFQRVQHTLVVK